MRHNLALIFLTILITTDHILDYARVAQHVDNDVHSIYSVSCVFYGGTTLEVYTTVLDNEFPNNPPIRTLVDTGHVSQLGVSCDDSGQLDIDARYHLTKVEFIADTNSFVRDEEDFYKFFLWLPKISLFGE